MFAVNVLPREESHAQIWAKWMAWGGTPVLQLLESPGRKLDDGKQCWHTIWRWTAQIWVKHSEADLGHIETELGHSEINLGHIATRLGRSETESEHSLCPVAYPVLCSSQTGG